MTELRKGDHIYVNKIFYKHHGIYTGNWQVIHYTKRDNDCAIIDITSLDEFAEGSEIKIIKHHNPTYDSNERVQRAYSKLCEKEYDLIFNNCEHFVYWCFYGEKKSYQVRQACVATVVAGVAIKQLPKPKLPRKPDPKTLYPFAKTILSTFSTTNPKTEIAAALTKSSIAGTVAGTATGVTGASLIGGSASSLATGIAAASLSTIAAPAVAAVAVGYGVKKLFDWFFD